MIAYKYREVINKLPLSRPLAMDDFSYPTIIMHGQIAGTGRFSLKQQRPVSARFTLLSNLQPHERKAIDLAIHEMEGFYTSPIKVEKNW